MTPAPVPSIISAVVTPAILILACSSLITTTANRLSLLLDRVRELTGEIESFRAGAPETPGHKRSYVSAQLEKGARRVVLLQRTLATLYLALGSLILTSVCVGISAAIGLNANVVMVTVLASVTLLLYASTLLIRESRIALSAISAEMEYVRRLIAP
jgi:hypothetical protein